LQTNNTTPKARNTSWWDAKSDEEKRAHIEKMTAGRAAKRRPGLAKLMTEPSILEQQESERFRQDNGLSIREELADAFDAVERADAEFKAFNAAKRALIGNGSAKPITLLDAVIIVQDALERGELELVAHDGKPAFYKVTRERIA
jgi:hypothetical protein